MVIHWLIFPYPLGLLHWHCGNLTIAPVPAKQPWWIWINASCKFIMNDCITTTKQSTKNRVHISWDILYMLDLLPLRCYFKRMRMEHWPILHRVELGQLYGCATALTHTHTQTFENLWNQAWTSFVTCNAPSIRRNVVYIRKNGSLKLHLEYLECRMAGCRYSQLIFINEYQLCTNLHVQAQ